MPSVERTCDYCENVNNCSVDMPSDRSPPVCGGFEYATWIREDD